MRTVQVKSLFWCHDGTQENMHLSDDVHPCSFKYDMQFLNTHMCGSFTCVNHFHRILELEQVDVPSYSLMWDYSPTPWLDVRMYSLLQVKPHIYAPIYVVFMPDPNMQLFYCVYRFEGLITRNTTFVVFVQINNRIIVLINRLLRLVILD